MKYFLTTDISSDIKDITCPVLALNGTKDVQVSADKNLGILKDRLRPGKFNRIIPLEGLNHMFQHCDTGAPAEYSAIEETISPDVLDIIVNWISTPKH